MDIKDPILGDDKDSQNTTVFELEAQEIIHSLEGYDFSSLQERSSSLPYFVAGRTLDKKEFNTSNVNQDILPAIEKSLNNGEIPIIIGSYRMGKSTIAMAWEKSKKGREYISDYGSLPERKHLGEKKEIFVDEFMPSEENFLIISNLLRLGKKLVINPCGLEYFKSTEDGFKKIDISTSVIPIKPVLEAELQQYIEKSLGLQNNNKLAAAIAKLSGGSVFVTNAICAVLVNTIQYESRNKPINIKDIILEAKQRINSQMKDWDQSRKNINEDLQTLLPNPLLKYC